MGRQIKRVALDFDWPLQKVWEGYLMQSRSKPCPGCYRGGHSSGFSETAWRFHQQWYGDVPYRGRPWQIPTPEHPAIVAFATRQVLRDPEYYLYPTLGWWDGMAFRRRPRSRKRRIQKKWRNDPRNWKNVRRWNCPMSIQEAVEVNSIRLSKLFAEQWCYQLDQADVDALVKAGRLLDLTHTWDDRKREWVPKDRPRLTAREVNAWGMRSIGHDSINSWVCIEARTKRMGESHLCPVCNGEAELFDSPEDKLANDQWEPTEPPAGDGYQLWENVTEGSPLSPVFETPEELADWAVNTRQTLMMNAASRDEWLDFIRSGRSAPTGVLYRTA